MTETKKINKVLILGSGGLSIGQAGEFDYSGSQAIKALKEEGIKTILINPNIATIQTSKGFANEVYFLPVTKKFVEKIIAKERPDGILLGFGGQTALNCGMELSSSGVLEKYNVKVLGTPIKTIITSEDKGLFVEALKKINIKTPKSIAVYNIEDGVIAAKEIGYPLIIRAGFALGGLGSGFCNNEEELRTLLHEALTHSKQILVEESLEGWKEVEYEVMRDSYDNCMTVCNMENFDPLGIHTGESIVVAPSQTLTDKEYQKLREISINVIKSLGVVGECNVQFALDPDSEDYRVIEVNARLSRSSALASKATGYPLAFIAAKLALGYSLVDIPNPVTKITKAFFEPALDYVVVKIPRWDTDKFKQVDKKIGSSMKSVGEVMAIGRKFEEALQKAIRMTNPSLNGLTDVKVSFKNNSDLENKNLENKNNPGSLDYELENPTDKRIFALVKALENGYNVKKLFDMTKIDKWFLYKMKNIIEINNELKKDSIDSITPQLLRIAKQHGFSDKQVAKCILHCENFESEIKIRDLRKKHSIIPVIKQIDTLAGEFPCKTNYLYLTYNGEYDDVKVDDLGMRGVIVLGGGAYSIGSSVEFDWCCVECVKTLRKEKVPSIVINYNPETVSTDYDECDRLYFDELSFERVVDIYEKETPFGVIFSMGGQIPNNLVMPLSKYGVKTLGTDPEIIDKVEDRHKFSMILDELGVDQPEWKELTDLSEIKTFCSRVGFPILIRPSYVLSGAAMNVVYEEADLDMFLKQAALVSKDHPVVLTKFITHAKEIDVDLVALKGDVKLYAISEHIENAGVHSGDATLVTPPQKLYLETVNKIKRIIKIIVKHLNITGPANFQFLAKDNKIKIIECNLRASRSFPFVSKVYDINFIEHATKAIIGSPVSKIDTNAFDLEYVGVKAPQFSFTRLRGADPLLGVEMSSTGEVACLGDNVQEAFLKALLSVGFKIPKETILLSTGDVKKKAKLLEYVKQLKKKGYMLYGTGGTADFYKMHGIGMEMLHWPLDEKKPNVLDYIKNKAVDLVVNIPKSNERIELSNDYIIRRTAADFSVPLITNFQCTKLFVESICNYNEDDLTVKSWNEYHETLNK
ncbi:carbamoyl-phosphate synthase (glutamine-hydrolyzing) large subunit [Candidatus Woesearchaeota archaeon]|nr:carbamoyl-phosphate synthase (glutamine-hydrolyzing) large subunit [Candidatus Woesearchaeota archaeon]